MASVKSIIVLELVEAVEVKEGTTKALVRTGNVLGALPETMTVKDVSVWGLLSDMLKGKNVVVP